jgi:hypothetical protein
MLLAIFQLLTASFSTIPSTTPLPPWAETQWKKAGLGQTFNQANYVKPGILEADFNGDGKRDIAILITRKSPRSQGILILHQGLPQYHILGAGPNTSSDILYGNFSWVTDWSLYTKPITTEVTFDKSGDVLGGRTIRLHHPAIEITKDEVGGGMIYWNGKRYIWIHQTC